MSDDQRRAAHLAALRETFDMIDADGSGTIDASEFGTLLRLQVRLCWSEESENEKMTKEPRSSQPPPYPLINLPSLRVRTSRIRTR